MVLICIELRCLRLDDLLISLLVIHVSLFLSCLFFVHFSTHRFIFLSLIVVHVCGRGESGTHNGLRDVNPSLLCVVPIFSTVCMCVSLL